MIYKSFVITIALGLSLVYAASALAQTSGSQAVSRDAIGLRVVPNPEHLSPLAWYYKNIKVQGAPQSLLVDGYEAVRDGRTVYVNAANIATVNRCSDGSGRVCNDNTQCGINSSGSSLPKKLIPTAWAATCDSSSIKELFTNIYIISYNQNPEPSTTDILGQILQYWKFNINIKNCSIETEKACLSTTECAPVNQTCTAGFCSQTNKACSMPKDCPSISQVCSPAGFCNQTKDKACIVDADCPQGEYCNSKKSTIIRDTKRLVDLREVNNKLEAYNYKNGSYPKLSEGTYLTNRTISTWPSWSATLGSALGSALQIDPANKLGKCKLDDNDNARFEPRTCWDDKAKEFAGVANPLTLPDNSRAYFYQVNPAGNSFSFCSMIESGYIQAKPILSALCLSRCNNFCAKRECGDNGCGGSCASCSGGKICVDYKCVNP